MCVVRRMFGAQVCSVVCWLFGCGLVCLLVVLIVPLFLSFLAILGICCFLRVTTCTYVHAYSVVDILGLSQPAPALMKSSALFRTQCITPH